MPMREWKCRFVGGKHDGEVKKLTGDGTFPEDFQFEDGEEYSPIAQGHLETFGGHCIMRHQTATDEEIESATKDFLT